MKILANDGISTNGKDLLERSGFELLNVRVAQNQLINYINQEKVDILLVRSATKVTSEIIDNCPSLQLIGRGGVGLDNIDVKHAENKGVKVINTPKASSVAVAELVFAHLLGMVRFLHDSNRQMPLEGDSHFKDLKNYYSKGTELKGKTLGIVGSGNIGKEVAKIALGLGMKPIFTNKNMNPIEVSISYFDNRNVRFNFIPVPLNDVLIQSDFITLHTPALSQHLIGEAEINLMKKGSGIINTSRGGVLDEVALINAIEGKKIAYAALDVYETEPNPEIQLLMNPELSLSPHVGGSTIEAQDRIGLELAEQIINFFK